MAADSDIEMIVSAEVSVEKCRLLAKKYFDLVTISDHSYITLNSRKNVSTFQHLYSTALFWADKVCSLNNNEAQDVYFLGKCLFDMGQYRRAIHIIQNTGLEKVSCLMQCPVIILNLNNS